jgi:hypothetical protein
MGLTNRAQEFYGKKVVVADRETVEMNAEMILENAKDKYPAPSELCILDLVAQGCFDLFFFFYRLLPILR